MASLWDQVPSQPPPIPAHRDPSVLGIATLVSPEGPPAHPPGVWKGRDSLLFLRLPFQATLGLDAHPDSQSLSFSKVLSILGTSRILSRQSEQNGSNPILFPGEGPDYSDEIRNRRLLFNKSFPSFQSQGPGRPALSSLVSRFSSRPHQQLLTHQTSMAAAQTWKSLESFPEFIL